MSIERYGPFLRFKSEDGVRYVARIAAVQLLADVDEMGAESYVTIAGRTILVQAPLDELRDVLLEDSGLRRG